MLRATQTTDIDTAIVQLDAWLDTMRSQQGYGGPVAHWWQQSLLYTGAGLDWRYEGIIIGYVTLWQRTGNDAWLHKARRAGDDLIAGQLPDMHFQASAFEMNIASGGTPHEVGCDHGLLHVALALKEAGMADWQRYADCAERNIQAFYIAKLWDAQTRSFRDTPAAPTFVPNKAATACDALFTLAELTGDAVWVEKYAVPTLDAILAHQVKDGTARLTGAVAQNSFGARRIEKYFPIYNARCVSALVRGYRWTNDPRYLEAALGIMRFIGRWLQPDGSLPTVVYANARTNMYPSWIAPLGDVLRAADELAPYGFDTDFSTMLQRLLAGQDESGGIQTATGFAAQASVRVKKKTDARDLLHVVGWCDKAFRYLAAHGSSETQPVGESRVYASDCVLQGKALHMRETPTLLEFHDRRGATLYRWRKGHDWAEAPAREFWLR